MVENLQPIEVEVDNVSKVTRTNAIFYIGRDRIPELTDLKVLGFDITWIKPKNKEEQLNTLFPRVMPDAIICEFNNKEIDVFDLFKQIRRHEFFKAVPFIVIAEDITDDEVKYALSIGINDVYRSGSVTAEDIQSRIHTLRKVRLALNSKRPTNNNPLFHRKIILQKRLFDILCSLGLIILFSPIMLLISLLIWLESRGPVIYTSRRAGTGYQIFKFYKFRSMHMDADKELESLKHLNQYDGNGKKSSFVKISNDPRITKIGRFIRKTSLDELPQLFNVLMGDMSLVGNRPLPLYEAEMLTTDLWAKRFLAPAGITGLWQVTKRGKQDMSEYERMLLDVDYADKSSFWFDMRILFKTATAFVQKESV